MARIFEQVDDLLYKVKSPERYIGREWNAVRKNWKEVDNKVCLAFPDVYEIGMSHLGIRILYHLLNSKDDILCERVFSPWKDMEELMREEDIELFSLENKRTIRDFDIFGFTLQYELSYTTIINMLDLSGLPLKSENRTERHPLVMGGGSTVFNPEPISDFFDIFFIGEGETKIISLVRKHKKLTRQNLEREEVLFELAQMEGVYVPSLYEASYREGDFFNLQPCSSDIKGSIRKQYVPNLDESFYPTDFIVPYMNIVHDRAPLEISRGCQRGCRFCAAGMSYRPTRERSLDEIIELADSIVDSTGYEEISLTSLNTVDHSRIEEILSILSERYEDKKVSISLPSLRVNDFSVDLARSVQKVRRSGLTFAPEAGSQRLRDIINKGVKEEEYFSAVEAAFRSGWHRIKLYFMIGLPGEKWEDMEELVELVEKTARLGGRIRREKDFDIKPIEVQVNITTFVPKPFTPFQWADMAGQDEIEEKLDYLRDNLQGRRISLDWTSPRVSKLEGVLARGDRRLNDVILEIWEQGARLEGWSEEIDCDLWFEVLEKKGLSPQKYLKNYDVNSPLPWDHLKPGVNRKFLEKEWGASEEEKLTPDCRFDECSFCGVCEEPHQYLQVAGEEGSEKNDD